MSETQKSPAEDTQVQPYEVFMDEDDKKDIASAAGDELGAGSLYREFHEDELLTDEDGAPMRDSDQENERGSDTGVAGSGNSGSSALSAYRTSVFHVALTDYNGDMQLLQAGMHRQQPTSHGSATPASHQQAIQPEESHTTTVPASTGSQPEPADGASQQQQHPSLIIEGDNCCNDLAEMEAALSQSSSLPDLESVLDNTTANAQLQHHPLSSTNLAIFDSQNQNHEIEMTIQDANQGLMNAASLEAIMGFAEAADSSFLNQWRELRSRRPRFPAIAYVNTLEEVDVSSIPTDSRKCPHCWLPFGTIDSDDPGYVSDAPESDDQAAALAIFPELPFDESKMNNNPVKTPCGHIFGHTCLIDCLVKVGTRCPMCRKELDPNPQSRVFRDFLNHSDLPVTFPEDSIESGEDELTITLQHLLDTIAEEEELSWNDGFVGAVSGTMTGEDVSDVFGPWPDPTELPDDILYDTPVPDDSDVSGPSSGWISKD
ncbi:hypothetical protein K458DRAFT_486340 [Lentithecium fluviatile CBS 122367]|uniref:RING-type domain-containing protein n=1 Tax=Lentithecium fluviatile CBS 122367 TaxID=1168545 RepID=A0A6G1J8B9_9PLEO|nr:hypothetical protein K458DRAFT_486340 [Lentithecium fluviatile CBS 122367]